MTTGARTGNAIRRAMPAFLTYGFRPFFLAAGLWSAVALTMWIVMLDAGVTLPSRFDPLTWHVHEMLFGFVMAAIAGFLLTAIPNWTGRLPVSGGPLALLAALWLLGRIACLISATVPPWLAVTADLSFPVVLAAIVAREIIAGRNWRNLPMVAAVIVLGIANLLMHLEADDIDVPSGLGWRLGLAAVIVLISVVAGRVVPNFTRNWLAKRQSSNSSCRPRLDRSHRARCPACWSRPLGFASAIPSDRSASVVGRRVQSLSSAALARCRNDRGTSASRAPYRLCLACVRNCVAGPRLRSAVTCRRARPFTR